jgi:hypothetical protein
MTRRQFDRLIEHLFPGDGDEHGAVLSVGVARSARSNRLLVRELYLARDGQDYVPGRHGYRMLRAEFVRDCALACADEDLGYLAVHNHGGDTSVTFSSIDLMSHERGYPALLQLIGAPVGALVFARRAIAGDIWLTDGTRADLQKLEVVGAKRELLFPQTVVATPGPDGRRQRQTLLLGSAGQAILREAKVGVIGAGGVGSLIVEQLARLGVGHIVVVDPDRIEESNFSRIVGSREHDYWPYLTRSAFQPLRWLGRRLSRTKVSIAKRLAHEANRNGTFEAVFGNVLEPDVASRLLDCDFLFLAADSMQARFLFNAAVHQYLVPGIQIGAKAAADKDGTLSSVFSVARRVLPDSGCLWCNGLIPPHRLQAESLSDEEPVRKTYRWPVMAHVLKRKPQGRLGFAHRSISFVARLDGNPQLSLAPDSVPTLGPSRSLSIIPSSEGD